MYPQRVLTPILTHTSDAVRPATTVSVVIPAHNEEHRIGATLQDYVETFPDAELLVVLNGCTDGTRAVVERFTPLHPALRIIDVGIPIGKGGAICTGILHCRSEAIAYVDADGSTSAAELRRLIGALDDADAVIASRWLPGAQLAVRQPWLRRLASRTFNRLVRTLFELPFADTQCGAKVFRSRVLHEVVQSVETSSLAIDVDILYTMRRLGYRIKEVATAWEDREGSRIRLFSSSVRMLASLLRLRLKYSALRVALPVFDKLLPTKPMGARSRLKVLIFNWRDIRHPQAGGAETYLHEQAKRWVAEGHEVTWVTAGFNGSAPSETIDGVDIRRVGNAATVYFLAPWYYITRLRDRYDVVIDSENGIPFFSPLFSLKKKKLLIYHVHRQVFLDQLPPPLSWFFVWVETWLMPRIYANVDFIAISNDSKRDIERYRLTERPVEVVISGVDARLAPGKKSDVPLVVWLGRIKPYKRVDWVIEAFAKVRERVPGARLAIAGAGVEARRLAALASRLGVSDACEFRGFVSDDEKRELLQSAWVFASASSMEGWGIAAIEANACGTPAVVFDVPGLREAIVDGKNGLVAADRDEFAAAIQRVLEDPALRTALERGSLERAAAFSWDATSRAFLRILMRDSFAGDSGLVQLDGNWLVVSTHTQERP
jgi:glycosyltransferase involved in cell wall biosynthesis